MHINACRCVHVYTHMCIMHTCIDMHGFIICSIGVVHSHIYFKPHSGQTIVKNMSCQTIVKKILLARQE